MHLDFKITLYLINTTVFVDDVILIKKENLVNPKLRYAFEMHSLGGVHTVVHEAILPRTFVRVRPSQPRTRTKERVRVRRPPTMLDFLYVVHVYDVQMYELAVFR